MKRERKTHWRASKAMQARVRELRRAMTPAEKKLWSYLRDGQLDGAFFRKQHVVGPYILDFVCTKARLVVEVDGDTHVSPEQIEYDRARTKWLEEEKHYRVIRSWNNEVVNNIDGVLTKIFDTLNRESRQQRANGK